MMTLLLPTAIEKILKHLTSTEYELVYVSSYGIQDSYQPRTMPNVSRASEFSTPEELARHVHVFFTFMSGNIVNKDRVCNATHPPFSNLIGTNLIQLGWVYTALNEHRRSLFIHEPLVAARTNNTGGYGSFYSIRFESYDHHRRVGSTQMLLDAYHKWNLAKVLSRLSVLDKEISQRVCARKP